MADQFLHGPDVVVPVFDDRVEHATSTPRRPVEERRAARPESVSRL